MFRNRVNVLTFAGIKIGIDISWLFIAVLLTWTLAVGYFPFEYHDLSLETYWIMGLVGMLGLFVCIVLHEMGHALVAKHYKLPISQITLFIFGGIAEIKKEPPSAKIEFLVAIAGPIVSVVLSVFMYYLTQLGAHFGWPVAIIGVTGYLALINVVIVIFNLIPAFPLDGGRVFRSILWGWKKNLGWATTIATRLGTWFSFFLMFVGCFLFITGNFIGGIWLVILGLFLHYAATASKTQFYVGEALTGEMVLKFMKKDPISVSPNITIKEFIDRYVYESHHHLYPVADEGILLGYISLKEIKLLPLEEWEKTLVTQVMVPVSKLQIVSPQTSAIEALNRMHQIDWPILFVVEENHLVGILKVQDLLKLISLKLELEQMHR